MKIDRQHLVAICVDLFRRNGYHRTSMEDVAVACGLRKASLYHHFPSKETLALAALEQEHEWYTENVFRCALRRDLPPVERLRLLLAAFVKQMERVDGGCLHTNLTHELVDADPAFRPHLRRFFDDWAEAFAEVYRYRHGEDAGDMLGFRAVGHLHGAVMLLRLYGDMRPLEETVEELLGW